jgi:hypothetical protein
LVSLLNSKGEFYSLSKSFLKKFSEFCVTFQNLEFWGVTQPLWLAELREQILSLVLAPFDLLIVLAQLYSFLEFDLTLGVIPSV